MFGDMQSMDDFMGKFEQMGKGQGEHGPGGEHGGEQMAMLTQMLEGLKDKYSADWPANKDQLKATIMEKLQEMGVPADGMEQLKNSFEGETANMDLDQMMSMVGNAMGGIMEMMESIKRQSEVAGVDPEMLYKIMRFIEGLKDRFEEGKEFDIQEAFEGLKPELKEFGMDQEDFENFREMVKDIKGAREFVEKV
jgi:translation elongation factor EF-G